MPPHPHQPSAGGAPGGDERSSSRRDLIRRTAKATAVAWTVPLVIDGITNPAAAATCAKGSFYVAFELALAQVVSAAPCTVTAGFVNTTAAAVALSATAGAAPAGSVTTNVLLHDASATGRARPVTLHIAGCSCVITKVMGVVHRRGPAVGPPDCPNPACQTAGSTSLQITGGALNTATVVVAPNYTGAICANTPPPAVGIHWGAPATPNGKLVVEIRCG